MPTKTDVADWRGLEMVEVPVTDPLEDSGRVESTPGGGVSVPVTTERLVVTRQQVVVRRVIPRRERRRARDETVWAVLRREMLDLEIDRADQGGAALVRQGGGEDPSRGPTPRTRHPDGGLDDLRDATQGRRPRPAAPSATRTPTSARRGSPPPTARRARTTAGRRTAWTSPTLTEHQTVDPGTSEVEVVERPAGAGDRRSTETDHGSPT